MKFCQPHWNRLRAAIESKGMGHLVAKTGREAVERAEQELGGTDDLSTFDPLMAAHNAILNHFIEPLGPKGLYIFNGDICPLCEVVRLNPNKDELDENWIQGCTNHLLQFCVEKGLVRQN